MSGSIITSQFAGPYVISERLNNLDYVISSPDRRHKSRVCRVNMLKRFYESPQAGLSDVAAVVEASVVHPVVMEDEDGLNPCSLEGTRLSNSELVVQLDSEDSPLVRHLAPQQLQNITRLLKTLPSIVGDVPTLTSFIQRDIKVTCDVPIKRHPYRVNVEKRKSMNKEVKYFLEHGLAVLSNSPWSSPCLLVKKPDQSYRFCTEYRKLNAVTVPDSYPLPRTDDCVDNVGSA